MKYSARRPTTALVVLALAMVYLRVPGVQSHRSLSNVSITSAEAHNAAGLYLPPDAPKEKCKWYHESTFVVRASLSDADRKALDKLFDALVKAIDAASSEANAVKKAIDDLGPAADVVDVVLIYACEDEDGNINRKQLSLDNTENIHWAAKAAKAPENAAEQRRVIARHTPAGGCCKPKTKTSSGIKADANPTQRLIGLVFDQDISAGDQVVVSLTSDPKKYEKIPSLGVIELTVPARSEAKIDDVLGGLLLDPENHREQPATKPFVIQTTASTRTLPIKLGVQQSSNTDLYDFILEVPTGGKILGGEWVNSPKVRHPDFVWLRTPTISLKSAVPLVAPPTDAPADFVTPPVCQDTSFIRGSLSRNGAAPTIMIDDRAAGIIAASSRSVFFELPAETPAGPHDLAIRDGEHMATFPIVRLGLKGQIDQPSLQRGQKTNYSVTLNFGTLSPSIWQTGGGYSPELISLAQVRQAAPDFNPPKAGEPGVILLAINNASREIVSIQPSQNERLVFPLHQTDLHNNEFTTRGEVQSKITGVFKIDLLAQGFFAPIHGVPVAFSLKTRLCPNLCKDGETPPAGGVEVAFTPKGYAAGEIDKMASGVKIIRNVPIPAAGKPIRAAAAALIEGAFGFAEAVAKRNGQTVWVRVTCYLCEDESCWAWTRKNWVRHASAWEKVMDLESLTRDGGATLDENLSMDQIAEKIKEKADELKCP